MSSLINLPDMALKMPLVHGFSDHFTGLDTTRWTTVEGDTNGSVAAADGVGGIVQCAVTTTDNEEAYLSSANEQFLFAANKPLMCEARIKYAEASTDDANVIFGLINAAAANSLVDNGAGPQATYDGALFYKVDGETKWKVNSSNGAWASAGTDTTTEYTAGGSTYQTLKIEIVPVNSTDMEVSFFIDTAGGQDFAQCRENGANPRTPAIKHTVLIASATEMQIICGVKNGGANSETLNVDYIQAWQKL